MIKTFSGTVSAEVGGGEAVQVLVAAPDGTQQTLAALTDDQGNYSVDADIPDGLGYSAQAFIAHDANYQAAESAVVSFDVLEPRTISLTIS